MKKYIIIIITSVFSIQINCAQNSMSDFYSNKTQVVLLGLDFSLCKFIGKDAFGNPEGLKNHSIKGWNRFFASEPRKYSLQKAFGLSDKYYYNSINYFLKRNDSINTFRCVTNEAHSISKAEIVKNVKTYTPFEKEGLAVSFVVESFNKLTNEAHVWVTFISLPSNEIIYMEKMIGTPGGAGQLNYWARAVYDIVTQMEKQRAHFEKQ